MCIVVQSYQKQFRLACRIVEYQLGGLVRFFVPLGTYYQMNKLVRAMKMDSYSVVSRNHQREISLGKEEGRKEGAENLVFGGISNRRHIL